MIKYVDENRSFYLCGKDYSYVFYINALGNLQQLYYGKKIEESDIGYFISARSVKQNREDINCDFSRNRTPAEIGSFAKGDFRAATVIVKRADGVSASSFVYAAHEIVKGAVKISGMPCTRKADETLIVTLKDECSDIAVRLYYRVCDDLNVLVRNAEIINGGEECADIERAFSFCMDLPDDGAYSALRLAGKWAKERHPVTTPLSFGTFRIESACGYSSHAMNPFLAILRGDCSEISGECYGFNLLYSGSFAITAEINENKILRVQGGVNDYGFRWKLPGGECFVTPQCAIGYSSEGIGGLSRIYHDFFRTCVIDPKRVFQSRPIVVNNWEATYFDFDNERLFKIIDEAAELGIDTFVLDDGWFGKRDDDRSGLGDWFVNEKKLSGGLKPVIDRCKKNGLKFGLWFEPEMVSEDSDLFRVHPDWAIGIDGVSFSRWRNQLVLDFTRKEVVDYIYDRISGILNAYDISYVKWDKNREITENFSRGLPADRQGEFAHRYTLGFYDLAERLTENFPEVLFEGCASGGGRFDGGALYYFPQIWTSDDTDALERAEIQWGTSMCYPLSAMSCHVSACPNHQTGRMTPFSARGAIAALGATGYELDLTKLTDDEKKQVKEQIDNYKSIEALVLKGDLYRLSDPFSSHCFCEMIVSKDKKSAIVVGLFSRNDPLENERVLRLYGLAPEKMYCIRELDVTASGKALCSGGVFLPRLKDFGSWIWHLEEAR